MFGFGNKSLLSREKKTSKLILSGMKFCASSTIIWQCGRYCYFTHFCLIIFPFCYFLEKFIFENPKITFPILKSLHKYWYWRRFSFRIYFITWFICDVICPANNIFQKIPLLGPYKVMNSITDYFSPEVCKF